MRRIRQLWAFLTRPEVYWRLFSLALAVIFWLLAAGNGDLVGTERVVSLSVQVRNLPQDLALLDPPEVVKVRIRGLALLLNRQEESITAYVDLKGAVQGAETHAVGVEAFPGVEIVSINPRWVAVYTERIEEKIFPVSVALLGFDHGPGLAGFKTTPSSVTVTAPGSILNQVDRVAVYIANGRRIGLNEHFPVQALDAAGKALALVEIEPSEVNVRAEGEETKNE